MTKFRRVFSSRATIQKAKYYEFPEIDPKERALAKGKTHEDPLLIRKNGNYYALYENKGLLCIVMLHSYDVFEEGLGKHKLKDSGIDWLRCECGEIFRSSKTISAEERLNKHLAEIKELQKNDN